MLALLGRYLPVIVPPYSSARAASREQSLSNQSEAGDALKTTKGHYCDLGHQRAKQSPTFSCFFKRQERTREEHAVKIACEPSFRVQKRVPAKNL